MGRKGLDLLKGTLDFVVLKTVATREPMHGFEVLDWIRETTDDELVVEEGALYPALHRMERRGWLAAEWGISGKGRRAKYYHLTPAGRKALVEEERVWNRYVAAVGKIAARAARG